tara:strand:+ start:221 stop:628 length:408 start_codon:yes stop_codon:yes gene_type:complete
MEQHSYKISKKHKMERKETYAPDVVLSEIGDFCKLFDGDYIKMYSERYQVFKKSLVCSKCSIKGSFFAKERNANWRKDKYHRGHYHFNLYAVDENGNEVLMTKDHIIPKSKGGSNSLKNYETMCKVCNEKKSNII